MLAGELGERLAGADFQQDEVLFCERGFEGVAEMHGVAELARPVAWIREGCRIDGFAGAGGNPWDLRRGGGNHRRIFGEAATMGSIMAEWNACEVCSRRHWMPVASSSF